MNPSENQFSNFENKTTYKIGQTIDLTRWYVAAENISDLEIAKERLIDIKNTTPQNADFEYAITETRCDGKITYTIYEKARWKESPNNSGRIVYMNDVEGNVYEQVYVVKNPLREEIEKVLV